MLLRRRRARAYRRQALAQLDSLRTRYQQTQDANAYLAEANALLKSAALMAYPRRDIAASRSRIRLLSGAAISARYFFTKEAH